MARHDGWVVFVAGGIPGDVVRARLTAAKRAFGRARIEEILAPGPDRISPQADHPGVSWQVLPYARQLEIKAEQTLDALRRLGGLSDVELAESIPAEQLWRYRNKLEYSFGTDAEGVLVCGFHAPGRWDQIEALEDCLLASEVGNQARRRVLDLLREAGLGAWDRRSGEGALRNLVVREGRRTGEIQIRLVATRGGVPGAVRDRLATELGGDRTGVLLTEVTGPGEATQGGQTELLAGTAELHEELLGLRLGIAHDAFFQTNTEMAELLYAEAGRLAGLRGHELVFDLFCGIGSIGLSLAVRARNLWGLEIVEAAVACAIDNARANEIENVHFFAGDVRLALRELVGRAGRPDVLVVDPPRAGLSAKVVRRIIEAGPKRIVYVSCNPTTLAPNAAQLIEAGWALRSVRVVDMFPQTPHIECVALLERTSAPAAAAGPPAGSEPAPAREPA